MQSSWSVLTTILHISKALQSSARAHCDAEQLVSPDHHPAHFKGIAVFCKSTILLPMNVLMVMSPDRLVAFTDPFQLNLSPETAFAEPT